MKGELFYRLALNFVPGITNACIKKLIQTFGTAEQIFHTPQEKIQKTQKTKIPEIRLDHELIKQAEAEIQFMEKKGIKICFFDDMDYPKRMLLCSGNPNLFFYKGEPLFGEERYLSIVGTRDATSYGMDVVHKLVSEIAPYNPIIVSGLAIGIDTIAHEAALQNGLKTIGIMGSGFGRFYPASNYKLAQRMLESKGTIISEFVYQTLPDKPNFPKRNRLIASISDATLVIETKMKGGSVITANMASLYKRKVFAIPGSIFDPHQTGCNALIKSGFAEMISSGEEIVEYMRWNRTSTDYIQPKLFLDLTKEQELIYDIIQIKGQISIDELTANAPHFSSSKIAGLLLQLEFQGLIECRPGKIYRLIRR